jgi:hypothetical protein
MSNATLALDSERYQESYTGVKPWWFCIGSDNEPVDQDIPDVFMWGDTPLPSKTGPSTWA